MLTRDLSRQGGMQLALHGLVLRSHVLHEREGKHDHFAILESARSRAILVRADTVEAERLATHEKADDLFATAAVHGSDLEESAADRVYRVKAISGMEYGLAALQPAAKKGDLGESIEVSEWVDTDRFVACA